MTIKFEGKPWPVMRRARVFHVGTMNPIDKGMQGTSLEGNGLSVSLHPEAWTQIARLGGHPTWELRRPEGGRFLRFHALNEELRNLLALWAQTQGYLQLQPVWEVGWYDSDYDGRVTTWFTDHAAAVQEHEHLTDGDETASIQELTKPLATPALLARCGFDPGRLNDLGIAATFFAEDALKIDGVWWEDDLDVSAYSAPRGVINLTTLPKWTAKVKSIPQPVRPRS